MIEDAHGRVPCNVYKNNIVGISTLMLLFVVLKDIQIYVYIRPRSKKGQKNKPSCKM